MNQLSHQESVTANLQQLTSNPVPLLLKPVLWFQLSWVYLIIMTLVMLVFRFTLQSSYLNLTLDIFQIQTPLRSNQFMMMKWTISWNFSTHNMMNIFWVLTSRCFSYYWWLPLLQNIIQSLLCCFINMEGGYVTVTNFSSHFSMFIPTKATVKLANGNTVRAQGIGIILCHFLNCYMIYPVVYVYYCTGQPYNTISFGYLKF